MSQNWIRILRLMKIKSILRKSLIKILKRWRNNKNKEIWNYKREKQNEIKCSWYSRMRWRKMLIQKLCSRSWAKALRIYFQSNLENKYFFLRQCRIAKWMTKGYRPQNPKSHSPHIQFSITQIQENKKRLNKSQVQYL